MIKLGSTEIANVMLGTTKVDAIFLGNTKVYPILDLPAVEGVYVYHVDKKFYTFPEFQKLSNTAISQVLGFAIIDNQGSFLLPPRVNLSNGYRWCPENFDTFIVPDVGIGVDDLNGRQNTETLHNTFQNVAGSNEYAAGYAYRFTPVPIGTNWYLPSIGELLIIYKYRSELQDWVIDTLVPRIASISINTHTTTITVHIGAKNVDNQPIAPDSKQATNLIGPSLTNSLK